MKISNRTFLFYGGAILLGLILGLLFLQRYANEDKPSRIEKKEELPEIPIENNYETLVRIDSSNIKLTISDSVDIFLFAKVIAGDNSSTIKQKLMENGKLKEFVKPVYGRELYEVFYANQFIGSFSQYRQNLGFDLSVEIVLTKDSLGGVQMSQVDF